MSKHCTAFQKLQIDENLIAYMDYVDKQMKDMQKILNQVLFLSKQNAEKLK